MLNLIASSRYKLNRKHIKKLATNLLTEQGFEPNNEINIVFAGRNKLKELSKKYKDENVALPVLTFIYNEEIKEGNSALAEVIICYPDAVLMAAQKNKTVDQIIDYLVKHGLQNIFDNI